LLRGGPPMSDDRPAWFYELCKAWMSTSEFEGELQWIASRVADSLSESTFLEEAAWIVLCSGFRESVVRRCFGRISFAFFDWQSARLIVEDGKNCVSIAKTTFGNERKLRGIVEIAALVDAQGFSSFKERFLSEPLKTATELPYMGLITAHHLLKNLGVPSAKPDRHLVRLASAFGFVDAHKFCEMLSVISGDSVSVVDSILWRFCEQHAPVSSFADAVLVG